MCFIRVSTIITPPPIGKQPPARLVPAPRGKNGTPRALQILTTSTTSAVCRGKPNTSGLFFRVVTQAHQNPARFHGTETISPMHQEGRKRPKGGVRRGVVAKKVDKSR